MLAHTENSTGKRKRQVNPKLYDIISKILKISITLTPVICCLLVSEIT